MRIFLIACLAIITGILLGSASTIGEFGYQSLNPWHDFTAASHGPMFDDGHPPLVETKVELTPPPEADAQPKARVEDFAQEFGTVEEGDRGALTYVIHNDGDAPLHLEKGKSSCKCTVSEIAKPIVLPGESSEIVVHWRSTGATDKFHKRFTIKTNDREQPKLKFSVIGKVLPVIKFLPRSISAHTVVVGEPHELEARLFYYRDEPLQIERWRFNNSRTEKYFELTYEPLSEAEVAKQGAKSGFLCRIKILPGIPVGDGNQELSVVTNAHRKKSPRLNLFVQVNDAVAVFGTKVRSGWRWSDQSLVLKRSDDSPHYAEDKLVLQAMGNMREDIQYKIKEVVPAELQVELGDSPVVFRQKMFRTKLNVSMPDDVDTEAIFADLPEGRGHVVIETSNPAYPELRFDVSLQGNQPQRRKLTFDRPTKKPFAGQKDDAAKSDKAETPTAASKPVDTTRVLTKEEDE